MNVHLQFLACLLLANMFEIQGVSGSSTWKSEGQGNASDVRFPSKVDDNCLFEQQNAYGVKKWKSGISTVINAFLGFCNTSVGLKNLAFEYSSPSCVQIADKSTIMMESCVSHQTTTTPFLLQSGSINIVNLTLIPQISLCSRSLTFSSDDSNCVVLRNSIMTDLAVSSSDYFLLSGKSKSEQITNCAFRNMSMEFDKKSDKNIDHSCLLSLMENSLIYSCVNMFEGGISGGSFLSEEFICKNVTTHFGKREMNALEKNGQMNTTESQSFSLCEWTDCIAPQGGALYVHDNSNAILKVENSSFSRCNASSTRGGAIYALKIAECIVLHSTFIQCSCAATTDRGGGGIMVENINIQSKVDDCSFQNCSSGNDGGAINVRPTMTKKQKPCIINSIFSNCKVNHTTSSTGGAVEHWDCTDQVVISNWGHDIALHDSEANNIDSSCYSTRQTSNRVSTKYNSVVDKSDWLRNDFGKVRFVSSTQTQPNSKDTYACGMDKSYPCSTIGHCLTQLIPDFVSNVEVFSETIRETKGVDCGTNAFTIYGQSDSTTTVQTELEAAGLALFSVSTGALTVNDLALVHDSAYENNRASRLFEITGTGKMQVSRLNISVGSGHSTETTFTTELINVQGGMFQMENVNWVKTISTTSLISLSLINEISLTFSGSTFSGIERTRNGAAVISFSNYNANIDLDSCTFEGCGSTSSENGGSMMLDDGKDVCICGLSDYPCLSIDYSLDRLPEGNEKNINIIEKGYLQRSVDVSGISVKSDNEEVCSLECLSSLEGAEGTAMKIQGVTNFELIMFVMPSSFRNGVGYLMDVGSSEGSLTLKDCSFTKNEESGEEIEKMNYGLIKADEGSVVLEFVSMQSLCFSKDVISVLSSTILNIKNLTTKNVELEGASGLRISKSSRRENNEEEQDVIIEWSSFEEVTQNTTDDIPIIRNDNDDEPLKMVIRNTTMKRCGGMRCGKGGGMLCVLNEGGSFDCSFCTTSECFCSSTGRGGWLFLECTSVVEQPLNFILSNITFRDNSAFRGRDVYVRCHSIETQIVDEQFLLDFRTPFVKDLAIWGCTTDSFVGEEDLLLRVVKYQSETIFVSSATGNHGDSKQCGEFKMPCHSLDVGVQHIIPSSYSQLLISEETIINGECDMHDVIIRSLQSPSTALVHLNSTISGNEGSLLKTSEKVRIESVKFNFDQSFSYSGSSLIHGSSGQLSLSFVDFSSAGGSNNNQLVVVLNSTLLSIAKGILHVDNCSVSLLSFMKPSFLLNGDEVSFTNMKLGQIESTRNVVEIGQCRNVVLNGIDANGVKLSEGCILSIGSLASGSVSVGSSSFKNCSRNSEGASVLSASSTSAQIVLSNCSCSNCNSLSSKGSMMEMNNAKDVLMDSCPFVGVLVKECESEINDAFDEICEWNGSLVHLENSNTHTKEIRMENSSKGGISIKGGKVVIEMGMMANNNPFIEKYPSLRRNIICSDSASLSISSLKGGDGVFPDISMWILNDGCLIEGIVSERASPFHIPVLESVETREEGEEAEVVFKGKLLLPCNLSFMIVKQIGDEKQIEKYEFDESGFVSETEVEGRLEKERISEAGEEAEVRVSILFGDGNNPSSTDSFIVKNRSEPKANGDERIAEGGKERKSYWLLIVIVLVILLLIVLIVSVILAITWRKAKNENKDLREIVNDNIRKDPKAFEMVTMEMSPEAQWRRAEKEAEKKNEERMKKRVYEKSLGHSESSEHLLSESGSTEYILGKDSDKIPQWMLEKVEEEEIRKQTPSPSISSTCSTDSDSTFVRGEDLCPTTSSMSNLVDAMACSSPHEKLIVDLRDSLFMLLHGKNKTKEMAIGTLQEREQTAAQILFWVANGALHSFDEIENPLQSLSNLSPHIVLFSEHMVICIVMHSDLLPDDDSDSSSISSSTVVTSTSGNDDEDSLPSSAFEDEDSFKKECLRWKAPELQINKKMGATKESVSFSIGMMLWECLTLQIPFGEYEAEVAGQKIVNGERPILGTVRQTRLFEILRDCLSNHVSSRPSLQGIKRVFIQLFPESGQMITMSDAVDYETESEEHGGGNSGDGETSIVSY
eukprot:MONOS_16057.1-p1 / transcript=MONOS_16057.1 / gene=MONOS_16057 / organism=Monocercomonoides_exilis_PA203 / gene_product=unspecified product / transcript_product=unspecified product / location=Mono_scaffold01481:201-7358(+) / protein_length=2062 / sequence_SO=supercontig / SO=protein_coding / is_pseudo=false